jgi:DNA-directed RNA polymerase specialized sigma24 family protein
MNLDNKKYYPNNFLEIAELPHPLSIKQHARLEQILSEQTEKQQKAFFLYFRGHKSIAQIAEEEGVVRSNIRTRLETVLMHIRWNREYILTGNLEAKK